MEEAISPQILDRHKELCQSHRALSILHMGIIMCWLKSFLFFISLVILPLSLNFASPVYAAENVQQLLKAANKGDAEAQYVIGNMYYRGFGVQEDKLKAVEWASKACNQGHKESCDFLKGIIK